VVEAVDPTTVTNSFGKLLLIRHPLPDGTSRYVLYEHVQSIETNPRTGTQFKVGDPVYIGDTVARLGDANGYYETAAACGNDPGCAHLHFEMRRNSSVDFHQDPYYPTLSVANALLYSSPSLFIDDRSNAIVQNLVQGQWAIFAQNANAPSSTAFIEYNGERYSLKRAIQLGYIYQYVYEQRSGQWYYYPDVANVFFGAGNTYAVWSFVNGAVLNILVPGHNFKADRAKIDMLHRAASDTRFTDIKTEIWSERLSWAGNPDWELRSVGFGFNGGVITMYHATHKTNPLIRLVGFNDPATGAWNGWLQVTPNTLD
jgi:hypothetical protein